jgi:hypothetical protein
MILETKIHNFYFITYNDTQIYVVLTQNLIKWKKKMKI